MISLLSKAFGIWLLLLIVAIANGLLRENYLASLIGSQLAQPLSGLLLSILVLLISILFIPGFGTLNKKAYWGIGLFWVALTLSFEFIFGHFVLGKSWLEIIQVFNVKKGELFILVLFVTAVAPRFSAKVRKIS